MNESKKIQVTVRFVTPGQLDEFGRFDGEEVGRLLGRNSAERTVYIMVQHEHELCGLIHTRGIISLKEGREGVVKIKIFPKGTTWSGRRYEYWEGPDYSQLEAPEMNA